VVLVVEDEFLIAMELDLMLQRDGWRVLGPVATVAGALSYWPVKNPMWRCSISTYEASW
jgi:two-component system, response regulator PdtaR